jgi:hypothetical protein
MHVIHASSVLCPLQQNDNILTSIVLRPPNTSLHFCHCFTQAPPPMSLQPSHRTGYIQNEINTKGASGCGSRCQDCGVPGSMEDIADLLCVRDARRRRRLSGMLFNEKWSTTTKRNVLLSLTQLGARMRGAKIMLGLYGPFRRPSFAST